MNKRYSPPKNSNKRNVYTTKKNSDLTYEKISRENSESRKTQLNSVCQNCGKPHLNNKKTGNDYDNTNRSCNCGDAVYSRQNKSSENENSQYKSTTKNSKEIKEKLNSKTVFEDENKGKEFKKKEHSVRGEFSENSKADNNLREIINSVLKLLPNSLYDSKSKKLFGIMGSEDLLLIMLIFLLIENEDGDNYLIYALLYLLVSDYVDI